MTLANSKRRHDLLLNGELIGAITMPEIRTPQRHRSQFILFYQYSSMMTLYRVILELVCLASANSYLDNEKGDI
ncbi:hypothetical protein BC936DRAFT_149672 [Jimgerdemannia flammicorona]|uniref:Uncharacterized protein n=2 Tax=Jimgerdemannia flammicorona TaxID=994334 RepID=A0A433D0D2_9FUNG|nr:hypothetical protein BC936DRAFT_149672 [Jimgerdemannia flammicorona]RUS25051.1 hypothetical protein BC938DRAFT_472700 [Jimgerdemannia flammicorona]